MTVLVALDDVQRHLSNEESDDIALLEQLEANAVSDVARRSGRTLEYDDTPAVRVLDGTGSGRIVLPTPVTSGSVTVRTRSTQFDSWTSLASDEYTTRWLEELQTHELLLTSESSIGTTWPLGPATVELTYRSGWESGSEDLPGWLRDALLLWIGSTYATRVQTAGAFEEATGNGGGQLPAEVVEMFERHKRTMQAEGPPHRIWRA